MNYKKNAILLTTSTLLMIGCASTAPQTHTQFMKDVDNASSLTKIFINTSEKDANVNFSRAVSNSRKQLQACLPATTTTYGVTGTMVSGASTIRHSATVKQISSKKAQVTVKADQGLTFGPKGGDIMYAADITRTGSNRIHIKSASAINYPNLDDAIIGWAKGSKSCYNLPRF
ncbi:MAG: hypothetical protein JW682_03235 [Campylobacterales bacterium]|nr:hypothetical protein [Campylobacterales bacterium]HEO98418.1 hypothetical protein [Campylobacterota bacterium]